MKQIKIARAGYILVSILFYILGLVCITALYITPRAAAVMAGTVLIAYGVIKITGYLSRELYCLAFQYDFACGFFLIVLGIVVLLIGSRFNGYFLYGLGFLILLDSLLCIQTSVEAKSFGLPSWSMILASSILTGTLGVVLIVTNTRLVAGCSLLAEGFMRQYLVQHTVYLSPCGGNSDEKGDVQTF